MSYVRTRAPEVIPVEIGLAAKNLRVDGDHLNDLITMWIEGITDELQHEIGQSVMRQGWEGSFPRFCREMPLPHPAIDVTSITYVDANSNRQSMDVSTVEIIRTEYASVLVPKPGYSWPATHGACRPGTVKIAVDAGYGDSPSDTPKCIRLYILAKLADQFDPVTQSDRGARQSAYVDRLLDSCRSYA